MKKYWKKILAVLCAGMLLLSCNVMPALSEETGLETQPQEILTDEAAPEKQNEEQPPVTDAPSAEIPTDTEEPAQEGQNEEQPAPADPQQAEQPGEPAQERQNEEQPAPVDPQQAEQPGEPAQEGQNEEQPAPADPQQAEQSGEPAQEGQNEEQPAPVDPQQAEQPGEPAQEGQNEEQPAPVDPQQAEQGEETSEDAKPEIDTTIAAFYSPAFQSGYAMILDETTVYREEMPTDQLLTTLYGGMTVYVRGRINAGEYRDQLSIVFQTSQGLQYGFISAKNARPFSRQESFAFSAGLLDDSEAGEYNGHLLKKLNCQIIAEAAETTDETQQAEPLPENKSSDVTEENPSNETLPDEKQEEAAPGKPQEPKQTENPAQPETPAAEKEPAQEAKPEIDTAAAASFSPAFQSGYAMILDETTVYREETPTDQRLTVLYAGMTVYVRGRVNAGQDGDQLSIVFQTSQGVQSGFIPAENARPFSRQESFAFSAGLIDDSEAGEYSGHLLKKLDCQIVAQPVESADEAGQTPAADSAETSQQSKKNQEDAAAEPETQAIKTSERQANGVNLFETIASGAIVPGDADQDNQLTKADGIALLNAILGLEPMTEQMKLQCDVDGNGTVDVFDAIYIMSAAAGLDEIKPVEDSPFTYADCGEGQIEVTGYKGTETELVIPDSIGPNKVVRIAEGAFKGGQFTSVKIPASVTEIGKMAFEDCAALKSVILSDNVTVIGAAAFKNCISLSSMTIEN